MLESSISSGAHDESGRKDQNKHPRKQRNPSPPSVMLKRLSFLGLFSKAPDYMYVYTYNCICIYIYIRQSIMAVVVRHPFQKTYPKRQILGIKIEPAAINHMYSYVMKPAKSLQILNHLEDFGRLSFKGALRNAPTWYLKNIHKLLNGCFSWMTPNHSMIHRFHHFSPSKNKWLLFLRTRYISLSLYIYI